MKKFLFGLAVSTLLLGSCKEIRKSSQDVVIPVRVTEVVTDTMGSNSSYVGTISADKSIVLSFESGGCIRCIHVREGQKVQKGQLLAELDNRTALNAYNAAKVTLDQAEDGYRRAESIYKKGSLPEVKWVEIQTQLNQARSMADICKKSLENCKMYAPQSGTIGNMNVEAGMNVMPFQSVMQLLDMGRISVQTHIPENEIASLRIGQKAKVQVNALQASFDAEITEIGVVADPLSHAYPVSLRILEPDQKLLPGMVCRVSIYSASDTTAGYDIPMQAVQISNDGREFVWICQNGKAHKAYIRTEGFTENGVRIIEGLQDGDLVITEGAAKVCEDTQIKIQ